MLRTIFITYAKGSDNKKSDNKESDNGKPMINKYFFLKEKKHFLRKKYSLGDNKEKTNHSHCTRSKFNCLKTKRILLSYSEVIFMC